MTKAEMIAKLGEKYQFSIRAQRELDKMADDANVDKFIRIHHIKVNVNPNMVAWQKVQKAQDALAQIRKEDKSDLFLVSVNLLSGNVEEKESETERELKKNNSRQLGGC